MKETLLIVDDEPAQLEALAGYLKKQGYQVHTATNGEEGLEKARQVPIDVILTDMRMPRRSGLDLIHDVKTLHPEMELIVITAFSSVEEAVNAMKAGAADYLQKPLDLDQVDLVLKKVLEKRNLVAENQVLKEILHKQSDFRHIITTSPAMENVIRLAGRASQSKATVLIHGESGTGKELVARAIHLAGPRRDKEFVPVNITAVPENLVESEFFGHEKGAFTGADRTRRGRFEIADGGTLFIDEIGDMPVSSQVKLLRVLQERSFERVGGSETLTVDVRVMAATHQNLEDMVRQGKFREDLFYRLNVLSISIPPLRERREDIPLLIDHFVRKYSQEEQKEIDSVSKESLHTLMEYAFPGNVRELENIIQRAVVLARTRVLSREDLALHLRSGNEPKDSGGTLPERLDALEAHLIREALKSAGGNQSAAARALGITERNLRYKLSKQKTA